jgi:tetratricopeptide (TPR) repeat protein
MEEATSFSLLTTWEMSLPLLDVGEEDKTRLQDVLTLFAFFHPFHISEMLFSGDEEDDNLPTSPMAIFRDNGQWNHLKFERAIVQMQDQSLVQFSRRNQNEIVVSLHSMVSEWLRMRLDESWLLTFLKMAASHLGSYLSSAHHSDFAIRQEALSHIDNICQLKEFHVEGEGLTRAASAFGVFYAEQTRLKDAEGMYSRALAEYQKVLGPDHTSTLDTVGKLGRLYAKQGQFEDAERMYNRALVGYEKALGCDHTSTLATVNNLGLLYTDQGQLEDAERMYNHVVAGREKALGPDHTSTLDIVHNLGLLYIDQGRLEDAERMHNHLLAKKEKALGPDHTSTLSTVHNLGKLYADLGQLEDAERIFNRALAGREKALGPDHTSTLNTVHALGPLYVHQGRLEDAERMYNRALAGYEKALGPDHKSTLRVVHDLGLFHESQAGQEKGRVIWSQVVRDAIATLYGLVDPGGSRGSHLCDT